MNSTVREDGVAIHFSMASIRGAWITDGKITAEMGNVQKSSAAFAALTERRDEWVKHLERQGLQFRFLASPQIEAGALKDYRVLILPYSIALSEREAAEIESFMDRGGIVYADEQTGRMDERCRWRAQQLWIGPRKGLVRRGPGEVDVKSAVPTDGQYQVTVRNFGESTLIGLLPEIETTYALPPLGGVVYDLLRAHVAGESIEAGPGSPVLLLRRASAIARLEMDAEWKLRLTDENGRPVDRSVVHIEVTNPEGSLVREYGCNVGIIDGAGRFEIPFALSDARGRWHVRARDAISGLTAEQTVTPGNA
jgi:hypothetical protein